MEPTRCLQKLVMLRNMIPKCDFNEGITNCTYDSAKEDPRCARETVKVCTANGGKNTTVKYKPKCNPTENITFDLLKCWKFLYCTETDIREFMWQGVWMEGLSFRTI